jgi:hypothetical protein
LFFSPFRHPLPKVPPLPFDIEIYEGVSAGPGGAPAKKRLRIGYYLTDEFFETAPACQVRRKEDREEDRERGAGS